MGEGRGGEKAREVMGRCREREEGGAKAASEGGLGGGDEGLGCVGSSCF